MQTINTNNNDSHLLLQVLFIFVDLMPSVIGTGQGERYR